VELIVSSEGRWDTLLERVTQALEAHTRDEDRHDDITLLAVRRR